MADKKREKKNIVTVLSREEYLRQCAASDEALTIRLTNNYAFRKIFKNEKVLKGFIMALLNLKEEQIMRLDIVDLCEDGETGEVYSSKFVFHMIELKKLKAASEEERKQELYHWAKLIAATSWEELRMEAKGNPYREAAVNEMDKINQSETERYLYLRREMAISDEKSRLISAENKGREEGMQVGQQDGESIKLIILIKKKCQKGKKLEKIAEELEEDVAEIRPIVETVLSHMEESAEEILDRIKKG